MARRVRRSLLLSALGALALVTGAAGLAWACTPNAYISLNATSVEADGGKITVSGYGFVDGPVRIRIDSGKTIAIADGPQFSTVVRVPKVKAGTRYVYAIAYQGDGDVAGEDSKPLKVRAPAAPSGADPVSSREPVSSPEPVASRETAPRRERPRAPSDRASAPEKASPPAATSPEAGKGAPVLNAAAKAQGAATKTSAPAGAARRQATPPATTRALPPLVTSLRGPWSGRPSGASSLDVSRADAEPPTSALVLGVGLLALGLAGIAGAGFALIRSRVRPPAPEPGVADLAPAELPLSQPAKALSLDLELAKTLSLEAELEQLVSEHAARAEPEDSGDDASVSRETVGSAS